MTTIFFLRATLLLVAIIGTTEAQKNKWSKCKTVVCDKIDVVKTDLEKVQTDVGVATSELTAIKADISLVKSDMGTATSELATIQSDMALKTDLLTVTQDIATMNSQMGTATGDLATVESNVATVKSDVESIKTDLSTLQRDMNRVQQLLLDLAYDRAPLDQWGYHQYGVSIISRNWAEHVEKAETCGGHLVTLTSPEQNELLAKFCFSKTGTGWPYFFGAYNDTGVWKWQEDDSTLASSNYMNWIGGASEPPGDDDCAVFSMAVGQVGSWFDNSCEQSLLAIYGFRQPPDLTVCDPNVL